MTARAAVILAAGLGKRMRSPLHKVLHTVGGRTMLDAVIDAAEGLGAERIVVVHGAEPSPVADHARRRLGPEGAALQADAQGTAHAVRAAEAALAGFDGDLLVTNADAPLLGAEAVAPLFAVREAGADLAVLGFRARIPGGYGRLVLGSGDRLERIVEAKDATAEELALDACNSNVMCASAPLLFELLAEVRNDNAQREYYLPDVVAIARDRGLDVRVAWAEEADLLGVNSQSELADAEAAFQTRMRAEALHGGACMPAPETVMFSWDTRLSRGSRVEPYVVFGPRVTVEEGAVVRSFSHLEGATVRAGATVGPYARLRPGADIGEGAHIGNFVEVKNAQVGPGAKANHLAYVGDGSVGPWANLGAGTIFCNYDGFTKSRTEVGEGAFVGSNSSLVAPVRIGAGAYVASGSVITADVEADALALGRARQEVKPGWAARFRTAMARRKR